MVTNNAKPNPLINEKSPYLLQHAYNPVEWHPWNEETFKLAKKEDKPIFLSIGYSTCYWCHVMEREVFEDPEIAELMNKYFVNIKVDREERPDVDRIYMIALQAMTGAGGWPMSMFLTPDLKPFYGATYIPPKAKYGRTGFEDVIEEIFGEINDEFDSDDWIYTKKSDDTYIFEGRISLIDVKKIVGLDEDVFEDARGDSDSLGGLILELHGKIPEIGDIIEYKNFELHVESVSKNRINMIKFVIKEAAEEEK